MVQNNHKKNRQKWRFFVSSLTPDIRQSVSFCLVIPMTSIESMFFRLLTPRFRFTSGYWVILHKGTQRTIGFFANPFGIPIFS
jgi:hypothetical protein